jgi:NADH-quinone oxidoreductase subunit J
MLTLSKTIFIYHAVIITALSLVAVTRRNPVHSVLFMLVVFFHIASLYLFLNAEFIAAVQIIVYAGAILVLFLFVIFLLNLRAEMASERFSARWPTGAVLAIGLFTAIYISLKSFVAGAHGEFSIKMISEMTNTKAVGTVLYTKYLFPFELASVVLLVAIVGAITLAKKHLR